MTGTPKTRQAATIASPPPSAMTIPAPTHLPPGIYTIAKSAASVIPPATKLRTVHFHISGDIVRPIVRSLRASVNEDVN